MMNKLTDVNIFFTGATTGLGKVAALNAAANGATVLAAVRDMEKGKDLQAFFEANFPESAGKIDLILCDMASLESVNEACKLLLKKYDRLDVIVNNAGTWNFAFSETADGIEDTFQVNVLAPVLIVKRLLPLLSKSKTAKVINTASGLHQGTINFSDIEYRKSFSGFKAYRQSKLAMILLSRYYQHEYADQNIFFCSQHPGFINTELVRKGGWFYRMIFKVFGKSPEKGAETLIHLIYSPVKRLKPGAYYKYSKVAKTDTRASYDLVMAERLHNACQEYLKDYLS